jgi:hypothetical protein
MLLQATIKNLLTVVFALALLACQESPSPATPLVRAAELKQAQGAQASRTSTTSATSSETELQKAAQKSQERLAAFELSKADFSPMGQTDCDAFLIFAKQCFTSIKMPGTESLLPHYFNQLDMLRRMSQENPRPDILDTLCKQQVDSQAQLKAAFQCEG